MGAAYCRALTRELEHVVPRNRIVDCESPHHFARPLYPATARKFEHRGHVLVVAPVPVTEQVDGDAVMMARHFDAGHKSDALCGGSSGRLIPPGDGVVVSE